MTRQIIEVEADSLEQARTQLTSQIPEGFPLLSERIISEGKPHTVKAVAASIEEAFIKAQSEVPPNAQILEKKELSPPGQTVTTTVEAFDEQSASQRVKLQVGDTAIVKSLKVVTVGKKGFLGIGESLISLKVK